MVAKVGADDTTALLNLRLRAWCKQAWTRFPSMYSRILMKSACYRVNCVHKVLRGSGVMQLGVSIGVPFADKSIFFCCRWARLISGLPKSVTTAVKRLGTRKPQSALGAG